MGNWNGTVRCGHCYGRGHNRTTCEKLTEQLQDRFNRLQQAVKDGSRSEDDYTFAHVRQQLSKRTGEDPVTGEKVRRRRESYGGRVCSYCQESGHNRRTCPQFKKDKATFVEHSKQARAALLSRLQEHGVGTGALLTKEDYDGEKHAYLVTGFSWGSVHRKSYCDGSTGNAWLKCRDAKKLRDHFLHVPASCSGNESYNNKFTIAGPVPVVQPPDGWLDCEDLDVSTVGLFDKGEHRDYYFWRDIDQEAAAE